MGEDILYGRKQAQLSVIVREELRVKKRKRRLFMAEQAMGSMPDEELLFEKLRELRKTIANEIEKPAYIVLSDKSLRALASEKPTNLIDGDIKYQIDRAENVKLGGETLYVWAIVRTVAEVS